MVATAAQAQAMAGGEREVLVPVDLRAQIDGGEANNNGELNHVQKKWLMFYWLLLVSVMILANILFVDGYQDDHIESKNPYSVIANFVVFLCAIWCILFRVIKKCI